MSVTAIQVACLAVLAVAATLVLLRIERGPSMLDRAISIDVITSGLIGFTAIFSAMRGRTDLLAVMAALSLVGFLSTVTIARFMGAESDEDRRILTREEMLVAEASLTDEDAPVHDVDEGRRENDTGIEEAR